MAKTWKIGALLGLAMSTTSGCRLLSAPPYKGPLSDHFDGRRFHNVPDADTDRGMGDVLKWMLHRQPGPWRSWTDSPPGPPPPARVASGEMRITFINHATTLLQMDGLNILTDPVYSERVSPFSWIGPKRTRPPGIRFEDLPPIDIVLISHSHYDHCDIPTLRRLVQAFHPHFFGGLGMKALLEQNGIESVTELDWWQEAALAPGVALTSVPAQHWSNRGMADRNQLLWGGFVIEGAGGPAFFAGDTGYGPHFASIRAKFGPMRLALLPIGAFRPRWFMAPMHMSPADAILAFHDLEAGSSLGIHFGTFKLADDGQEEPLSELAEALKGSSIPPDRFWALQNGEARDVPPLATARPVREAAAP